MTNPTPTLEDEVMRAWIWKLRFTYIMARTISTYDIAFCWRMACAWIEDMDWQDETPRDCVLEELSNWND